MKKIMLGTSDACWMSCLSHQPSISYWRMSDFKGYSVWDLSDVWMETSRILMAANLQPGSIQHDHTTLLYDAWISNGLSLWQKRQKITIFWGCQSCAQPKNIYTHSFYIFFFFLTVQLKSAASWPEHLKIIKIDLSGIFY